MSLSERLSMNHLRVDVPMGHSTFDMDMQGGHIDPFLADLLSPGGVNPELFSGKAPEEIVAAADVTPHTVDMIAGRVGATIVGSHMHSDRR